MSVKGSAELGRAELLGSEKRPNESNSQAFDHFVAIIQARGKPEKALALLCSIAPMEQHRHWACLTAQGALSRRFCSFVDPGPGVDGREG